MAESPPSIKNFQSLAPQAQHLGLAIGKLKGHANSGYYSQIDEAASEFDDRPGPVRDAVAGLHSLWQNDLRRHIRLAIAAGDLPEGTDADQLLFELGGLMLALNHALQLYHDRTALERTRRAMSRLLGRPVTALAAVALAVIAWWWPGGSASGPTSVPQSPVPLEYSIAWLTCAFASTSGVVMVGLAGAAQGHVLAYVPGARPGRPGVPR